MTRYDLKLVTWNPNNKNAIAKNIDTYMSILRIDDNGKVKTSETMKLDACLNLLSHYVEIQGIKAYSLKRNLLFRAGFNRLKKYKVQNTSTFKIALSAEARRYLRQPLQTYYAVYLLHGRIELVSDCKNYSVLGKTVSIESWESIEERFRVETLFTKSNAHINGINLKKHFTPVIMKLEGRNSEEVGDLAHEHFDFLRNAMNFIHVSGIYSKQWGHKRPLAEFLTPPLLGIFNNVGEYESYYYYVEAQPADLYRNRIISHEILEVVQWLMGKLGPDDNQNSLKALLVEAIRKYGQALDTVEWRFAYLELWQILELLTLQSEEQLNMRQVRGRVFNLLSKDEFVRELMVMLSDDRNVLVHEGKFPEDSSLEKVSLLKYIVSRTIHALIDLLDDIPDRNTLKILYTYLPERISELKKHSQVISLIQNRG